MPTVPILMYHHVSPQRPARFAKYTVHPEALAAQLRLLRRLRYTPVGLDALLAGGRDASALPSRAVVLTFDDGFAEAIDRAVPILQAAAAPATFFLVAGRLGMSADWLQRERGVDLALAGPDRARELVELGFMVGSHTWSHPHLPALDHAGVTAELRDARRALEDVTGSEVAHLAYPHGEVDGTVRAIAKDAGYRSACTTEQTFADPTGDPLVLPRIIVDGRDRLPDLACRLRTARSVRELVRLGPREALSRLRHAPTAEASV